MAQELKSKLQPNINNDHALSTLTGQVCFHRQPFADPVNPYWCITRPMGPLVITNQSCCGVKLLTMFVSTHSVGRAHICHLLGAQCHYLCPTGKQCPPSACPPTSPPTPPPSHPPLHTTRVILQGLRKNYLKNQL